MLGHWELTLTLACTCLQLSLTAGSSSITGCVGFLNAIDRVQFPGMCFQDAGKIVSRPRVRSSDEYPY